MHMLVDLQRLLQELGYLAPGPLSGVIDAGTRDALRRFQRLHGITPDGVPDEATEEALVQALEAGECIIHGKVVWESTIGEALDPAVPATQRFRVTVFDRDLRGREELGSAVVRAGEPFVLRYALEQARSGDREMSPGRWIADLVFRVTVGGQQLMLPTEHVVVPLPDGAPLSSEEAALGLQAGRVQEVRLELAPFEGELALSEFDRLVAAYLAVWPEEPLLAELNAGEEADEVRFAARELGVDEHRLSLLARAHRLAHELLQRDAQISAAPLYGIARVNGAIDLPALSRLSRGQIATVLREAIDRGIIPARVVDDGGPPRELDVDAVALEISGQALAEVARGDSSTDAALLSDLDDRSRLALLKEYAEFEGSTAGFWEHVRSQEIAEPDALERARGALQLGVVARGHLPFVQTLREEEGILSARDIALRGWDADALMAVVRASKPEALPGDDEPDVKARRFAERTALLVQAAYPTESVAHMVRSAEPGHVGDQDPQQLSKLLELVSDPVLFGDDRFDLRTSDIDEFVSHHGHQVLGDDATPGLLEQVKRLQRLFRLSTSPTSMAALIRSPFGSAAAIAGVPQRRFVKRYGPALGGAAVAQVIHRRATVRTAALLEAAVHMHQARAGVTPVMSGGPLPAGNAHGGRT